MADTEAIAAPLLPRRRPATHAVDTGDKRKMKDRNPAELPREKLKRVGPAALEDYELVAILLRTGIHECPVTELSKNFIAALPEGLASLRHNSYLPNLLETIRPHKELRGIGPDKLITLLAAQEIGARIFCPTVKRTLVSLDKPEKICDYMMRETTQFDEEATWAIWLNIRNHAIGRPEILTQGVRASAPIDPAYLFKRALLAGASNVILVHNHPSGDVTPSQADIQLTARITAAGDTLLIPVLDHIIMGRPDCEPRFHSMRRSHRQLFKS